MGAEQQYIDLYEANGQLICGHSTDIMNAVRRNAFADFVRQGFPTRRIERYKYTDLSKLFGHNYGIDLDRRMDASVVSGFNPYEVFRCDVPDMHTSTFFVANDKLCHNKGTEDADSLTSQGVIVDSLTAAAVRHPDIVARCYGKLADTSADGITAFNTAFAQDGVFIYVPQGVVVDRPLQIINILKSRVDLLVNRRMLIVVEPHAQLRLLACDHTNDEARFLSTQVIEAYVGEGASFDFYELEENSTATVRISNLYLDQQASSNVLLNGMTLNNGTTRNMTRVSLSGEGAELKLYGMAVADRYQRVDNNTFVDHRVPHCTSNQLYKYVLDGSAVGAFAGLVKVEPGAHHTHSEQANRNLCATREAHMYTQPQLEIYNDDVRCNHGAAVGQLDENALFYMQQRGIPLKEARLLLMFAFVGEIADAIRIDALKERLHYLIEKRFRGELNSGCRGCEICKR